MQNPTNDNNLHKLLLMKQINYFIAFMLALLCGVNVAEADVVTNYKMDFNTTISTTAHDFKVGTGWGHKVESYEYEEDDGYWTTTGYVSYTYFAKAGRDGTGALKVGTQKIGNWSDSKEVNDLLVTPKITGKSSIYVKKNYGTSTIKFYEVTKSGTTYTMGAQIEVDISALNTSDFIKVEIPAQEGKLIGIRCDDVTIDDFEAEQAEYELQKAVTLSTFINKGSSEPDCTADGKFPVHFTVKVKNTGDVALTPGMENYSLSLILRDHPETPLFTVPVSEALELGAETTVAIQTTLDYATYSERARYDVMENFNKKSISGAWLEPVAYLPKIKMRNEKDYNFDAGESFAYGMVSETTSKKFYIQNVGAAPLKVTEIVLPEGFTQDLTLPATIEAHKKQEFNITLPVDVPGIYGGNVTVKGEGAEDFTFAVSGTVRDATKYYENFESNSAQEGTYMEENWKIAQRDYTSGDNVYLASNSRRDKETKFITPLLKVNEGEKMTFDAGRTSSSTTGEDVYLKVYYSKDRQNWTLAKTIPSEEMSSLRANYNYYFGALTTYILDNIPAGNYYIGFGAGYTCIDNLYGFEKVSVAHDLIVSDVKMPATGIVNNEYEAKVTIKNISTNDEEAGSYTMSLYAGEEVVATAEAGKFTAGTDTTYTFRFTPHTAGTLKLCAKFVNATDGFTLSTGENDVTINEETAVSKKVIGDLAAGKIATNNAFYWMNADNKNGGTCDFYYPVEMLQQYGLQAGDKITGISYTGKPNGSKDMLGMEQTLSIGLVDEASYVPGENTESLKAYELLNNVDLSLKVTEDIVSEVKFTEPIVWDGTSALRVSTYIRSNKGKWVSVTYPSDQTKDESGNDKYKLVNQKIGDGAFSTNKAYLPITTLEITSEPVTFAGTVKCGETGVANATVTLTSGEVIYTGKTDETGAFSFPVIQAKKIYTLTVTADKYKSYTAENIDVNTAGAQNISLEMITVKVDGKVVYKEAGLAGATVTLSEGETVAYSATTNDAGEYAFDAVEPGKAYTVKVTAEKFNAYTSEAPVQIDEAKTLDDIVMTKPDFKVYGVAKWGETPLEGVEVKMAGDGLESITATTDAEGKYELTGVKADEAYTLTAEDKTGEFKAVESQEVNSDVDTEKNFAFSIIPISVSIDNTGVKPFSYKRALDFSGTAVKAYVVKKVNRNYTELTEIQKVPAGCGVILKADADEYSVTPIEKADAVEGNLLVGTVDKEFTIKAASVGKAWSLKNNDGIMQFMSEAGTKVAKNSAYLAYESTESVIYLNQADGIRVITTSGNGMLDESKPMYNFAGQRVGKDYKGVVIQNGKKYNK